MEGNPHRLLIDAGSDIRRSLKEANISPTALEGVYISHLHADHSGGIPDISLMNFFTKQNISVVRNTGETDDSCKPTLYGVGTTLKDGWNKCWEGPLETLELMEAKLDDFFNVRAIRKNDSFEFAGLKLTPFQTVHVVNGFSFQNS